MNLKSLTIGVRPVAVEGSTVSSLPASPSSGFTPSESPAGAEAGAEEEEEEEEGEEEVEEEEEEEEEEDEEAEAPSILARSCSSSISFARLCSLIDRNSGLWRAAAEA